MKKLSLILIITVLLLPVFSAYAAQTDIPSLSSISFNNAELDGELSPEVNSYTITLDGSGINPTLKSYNVSGSGELFVTYKLDEAKRQTGILVTISYDGGSVEYSFDYANAEYDSQSNNNFLSDISCAYCEVYPEINDKTTSYKLYIPSDMTELKISVSTKDVNAYCDLPKEISLAAGQEPELSLTVTAANGETRAYTLKIKRLKKNTAEIIKEMNSEEFDTLIKGGRFYNDPVFRVALLSSVLGIAAVLIIVSAFKRITVKVEDPNETEFFDTEK